MCDAGQIVETLPGVFDLTKRLFDLLGASLALLVLWLPMVGIAIAIGVQMGRPVLFRQRRRGRSARPFTLYKFRSMRPGSEPDEQRLTPLGRVLRLTSLDELPSFINVLKGDMSLVGPRPLLSRDLGPPSAEQARRHDVRPGITGLAQTSGRNEVSSDEKLRLDVWYVDNRTLLLDIKILLLTPLLVLRQHGVTKREPATVDRLGQPKS